MNVLEAYRVLGIRFGADADEIKSAWRRQAKRWHPDRAGGDERKICEINAAYALLTKPADEAPDLTTIFVGRPMSPQEQITFGLSLLDELLTTLIRPPILKRAARKRKGKRSKKKKL